MDDDLDAMLDDALDTAEGWGDQSKVASGTAGSAAGGSDDEMYSDELDL